MNITTELKTQRTTMHRFRNSFQSLLSVLLLSAFLVMITGCSDNGSGPNPPDYSMVPDPYDTTGTQKVVTEEGATYYIIKSGSGPFEVVARDRIEIKYTGRIKATGEIFVSSYEGGSTEPSVLSITSAIEGIKEGVIGMKIGGKRKIIVPPELGYTAENHELHGDTLVYDLELVDILGN